MFEQAYGSSEPSHPSLHGLFALHNGTDSYLNQLRSEDASKAREVQQQAYAMLAKSFEISGRLAEMIQHFRSLEEPRPGICSLPVHTVHDSVHQVLRAMQYEFPMEKATILKILPHDLMPSPIPRSLLEAVIFQLVFNAREALGEVPGIITIEAAEKIVLSPENRCAGRFLLRVADTGPGIPQDYLENLFDPFFAASHTCRLNAAGLCMVKKIVEHYQGLMRVETSLMGTSYFIELPRNSEVTGGR
jgi:signal transduction histidine kinase